MDLGDHDEAPVETVSDDEDSDVEIGNMEERPVVRNTWVQWFCSLDGHEFMLQVDPEYIQDPRNLFGLKKEIGAEFETLLKMIKSGAPQAEEL